MLGQLRALADDPDIRRQLAWELNKAVSDTKGQGALAMLDELRALARSYPDDADVRRELASGLCRALTDAEGEAALGVGQRAAQPLGQLPADSGVTLSQTPGSRARNLHRRLWV